MFNGFHANQLEVNLNPYDWFFFFQIFVHPAEVSATTNYDWNSVTEDEMANEVTGEIGITIGAKT